MQLNKIVKFSKKVYEKKCDGCKKKLKFKKMMFKENGKKIFIEKFRLKKLIHHSEDISDMGISIFYLVCPNCYQLLVYCPGGFTDDMKTEFRSSIYRGKDKNFPIFKAFIYKNCIIK